MLVDNGGEACSQLVPEGAIVCSNTANLAVVRDRVATSQDDAATEAKMMPAGVELATSTGRCVG